MTGRPVRRSGRSDAASRGRGGLRVIVAQADSLTPEEIDRYRKQGFVVREGVIPEARLEVLREAVEEIHVRISERAALGAAPDVGSDERIDGRRYQQILDSVVKWEWRDGSPDIRSMEPVHHLHAQIDALLDAPSLVGPCAQLLGCGSLSLFTDKLNFKRPGGSPFPWHQDAPYWSFGCDHVDQLVSLQLYLDAATIESGCLWMIPGSHRYGTLPAPRDRGVLGRLYTDTDSSPLAELDPVPIEAPAGSVIFFDGHVVHGSKGNRSAADRRALVLTYQPSGHARWNRPDERRILPWKSPT